MNRTRVLEIDRDFYQMHRNTRVDAHAPEFISKIKIGNLHRYPVIPSFMDIYSKFLGVSSSNILLTSGVDGAIQTVFQNLKNGATIGLLEPTYAMYRVYSTVYRKNVISILPNPKTFKVAKEDIIKAAKQCDAIFIPNPNAPIENVFDIGDIEDILINTEKYNCIIFIDEAYFGFGAPTTIRLINKYENLIVSRSFSKWFGLPSIRLGCLISNYKKILNYEQKRLSYETNSLSIDIAACALDSIKYFDDYSKEIQANRDILKDEFKKLNIKTHGSCSNNIIAQTNISFKDKKIAVRENIPYPGEGWQSITIGNNNSTGHFIKIMRELLL